MHRCTVIGLAVISMLIGCQSPKYTLGGTVTGLAGSGLVLQNLGGENLAIDKDGTFTFSTTYTTKTPYFVTVFAQPAFPSQVCTVSLAATGTAGTANITGIAVTCTTTPFAIAGTVTGLSGTGLVLNDNGGDSLTISTNGPFTFPTYVASGAAFAVSVAAQPSSPTQACTVANGTGTVANGSVTNVLVTCIDATFTVAGSITGLAGSGLVLQDNGGDNLTVSSGEGFVFATPLASGQSYDVTVATQPTKPTQQCVVSSGSGMVTTANITSVAITCTTSSYAIGGVVTGLVGTGLVLQDNGGDNLSVTGNGPFAFATPVDSGSAFSVAVATQPGGPTQTCTVSGGSGHVVDSAIDSIVVTCATNTYALSGTVSGLAGTGLVLQDNGGDSLSVASNGPFAFATSLASGANYSVTVGTQPAAPNQVCVVSNDPSGTIASAAITDIAVTCTTTLYPLTVNVLGLAGTGLVLDNGSDQLTITANGLVAFPTALPSGAAYSVTVGTQPASPTQTCTLASPTGMVAAGMSPLTVNCSTSTYTVGVSVSGLGASPVVLQDNGGDNLTVSTNGAATFATVLASGSTYAVSVLTQPTGLTCSVSAATGIVTTANVSLTVICAANTYSLGGVVTGLEGTGLVLANGTASVPVMGNGAFSFTGLTSGTSYDVTVLIAPTAPTQACTISPATGTITDADINDIVVTCSTDLYPLMVDVSGLTSSGLVLVDNGSDNLTVTGNGVTQFSVPIASGGSFAVGVASQPVGETCTLSPSSGAITTASAVVQVSCAPSAFTVGGTVSGLLGSGLVLQNGSTAVPISSDGPFVVASLASGTKYAVSVAGQPSSPTQSCTLTNGSGTVTTANVMNIAVTCTTTTFTINASVLGLQTGQSVVLQDNGGDNLTISSNTTAAFMTPVASGGVYDVTVLTQPSSPWQNCTVSPSIGTVTSASVTVTIACALQSFTIGGTVSGYSGSGLVLYDRGGDALGIFANGSFTFPSKVASGGMYSVTVNTQPSQPWQTCTVTSGTGTGTVTDIPVNTVAVTCATNAYNLGVAVTGLKSGTLVVEDNGGNPLSVTATGTTNFSGTVASESSYVVTISSQPAGQACTVTSGTGVITSAAVAVPVSCEPTYTIGGTMAGLNGTVVLQDNGGNNINIVANGTWQFTTPVASGTKYEVSVLTNPTGQVCVVDNYLGTVATSNVVNVLVQCTSSTFAFTACGGTGVSGPTQAQCTSAYASTTLAGGVTVSGGIQSWTVPTTGTWLITANGGQGAGAGSGTGGLGASIIGEFNLTQSTVLQILVGQSGTGVGGSNDFGGGGGGSFVQTSGGTILVIAGGGGGGGTGATGGPGQSGTTGGTASTAGQSAAGCPAGATGGAGGGVCTDTPVPFDACLWGSGGGGYLSAGTNCVGQMIPMGTGGAAYPTATGGAMGSVDTSGGCPTSNAAPGGFGGGGSGNGCTTGGGGGGGYNGGVGGPGAGGGGSYNSGLVQTNTQGGAPAGSGTVTITLQSTPE